MKNKVINLEPIEVPFLNGYGTEGSWTDNRVKFQVQIGDDPTILFCTLEYSKWNKSICTKFYSNQNKYTPLVIDADSKLIRYRYARIVAKQKRKEEKLKKEARAIEWDTHYLHNFMKSLTKLIPSEWEISLNNTRDQFIKNSSCGLGIDIEVRFPNMRWMGHNPDSDLVIFSLREFCREKDPTNTEVQVSFGNSIFSSKLLRHKRKSPKMIYKYIVEAVEFINSRVNNELMKHSKHLEWSIFLSSKIGYLVEQNYTCSTSYHSNKKKTLLENNQFEKIEVSYQRRFVRNPNDFLNKIEFYYNPDLKKDSVTIGGIVASFDQCRKIIGIMFE